MSWLRNYGTAATRRCRAGWPTPRSVRPCPRRAGLDDWHPWNSGAPKLRGRTTGQPPAVELTASVAAEAGRLAGLHALRGADAVHLASLLVVGDTTLLFAVWDQRLRSAAAEVGASVTPRA